MAADLNINGVTGDIKFDQCDALNIFVETTTGSVKGTIMTSKIFNCQSTSGSVHYPDTYTGGICKIKTTTGTINISYAK